MACSKFKKFKDCKDPDSYVPYSFDWSAWATAEGTTLVNDVANREIIIAVNDSYDATLDTTPVTADSVIVDDTNNIVYAWLRGGTDGLAYNVTCRITAANGIIEDQTAVLKCREK